jgi:hypothetical protein
MEFGSYLYCVRRSTCTRTVRFVEIRHGMFHVSCAIFVVYWWYSYLCRTRCSHISLLCILLHYQAIMTYIDRVLLCPSSTDIHRFFQSFYDTVDSDKGHGRLSGRSRRRIVLTGGSEKVAHLLLK